MRAAGGETVGAGVALFSTNVVIVVRWSQRLGEAIGAMGGQRHGLTAPGLARALARRTTEPSLTLAALLAELAQRGVARARLGRSSSLPHATSYRSNPP